MKISCHDEDRQFSGHKIDWRDAEGVRKDGYEGRPFRTCNYCGSIHPEDLLKAIEAGGIMHSSDWKYGWPHKFYVKDIPNPLEGMKIKVGSESKMVDEKRVETELWGMAGKHTWAKFYSKHLKDFDVETFNKLVTHIFKFTGVQFARDEKGVKYCVPEGQLRS